MWHILHADPGASIIHGLAPGVDRAALRRAVAERRVQDALNRVAVRPGDSVMVPAGTVHGILSGVVLLEVQQASDTTYRIHDWDRLGPGGRPRELHLDKALEVIDYGRRGAALVEPRVVGASAGVLREVVAAVPALRRGTDPGRCGRELRGHPGRRILRDMGRDRRHGFTAPCRRSGPRSGTGTIRPCCRRPWARSTLRAHTGTVAIRVFLP